MKILLRGKYAITCLFLQFLSILSMFIFLFIELLYAIVSIAILFDSNH